MRKYLPRRHYSEADKALIVYLHPKLPQDLH